MSYRHLSAQEHEAYVQNELQGAIADDDVMSMTEYTVTNNPDDASRPRQDAATVTSMESGLSRRSVPTTGAGTASEADPAVLFVILEEALPKQADILRNMNSITEQQQLRDQMELTWDRVRRWLWSHARHEERQAAAYVRGQGDATTLHLMCRIHNPPFDVIHDMLEAAPEVASWVDANGWLPLHHACANGAAPDVMQLLITAYPAGKLQQDKQMRTPLHFYATRNLHADNASIMATNAQLLSDTGAAALTDRRGMLPMHYACAYGTDVCVLEVLAEMLPDSLTAQEEKGRTPMHLAMVNALRDASPSVIRFLLDHEASRATINTRDKDGYLPLHLLALGFRNFRGAGLVDVQKRANVSECLSMYLSAQPQPAADFLTAIQDLPDWLQDAAVVSKHVRNVLNNKIVQPFPTSILMLDGYMLVMLIIAFAFGVHRHIDNVSLPNDVHDRDIGVWVALLFVGASYFLLREIMQIASLMSLGSFSSWITDPGNALDVAVIALVYLFAVAMTQGDDSFMDIKTFRNAAAFTQGILYCSVIVFLKSTYVDFAVFVSGVMYVVKRLSAFLMAVGAILLAFAQMFFFVSTGSGICAVDAEEVFRLSQPYAHCTFENSFLKMYAMMMGEMNDVTVYMHGEFMLVNQLLYVGYAFLVVILLSNVLIAIVTDSYEIIQNDRAAIVFWTNRLDFVAEMDAIAYEAKRRFGCLTGKKAVFGDPEQPDGRYTVTEPADGGLTRNGTFHSVWNQIMLLFDTNVYDEIKWLEAGVYNMFRIFCILVIIPLWIMLGALTAGWLWPPQIREALFAQKETTISRAELQKRKLEQLKDIQGELKTLKIEILREMANDRDEMMRVKAEVETLQQEVLADLSQVKELMVSLLGE